jgi:CBS domain-containing protein
MRNIETLRRPPVTIEADATVRAAAMAMEEAGVGALAVVDGGDLVGVVTDRDVVRRAVAKGLDADARIDGVMSSPALSVDADAEVHEVFAVFREHAVRRLAVVSEGRFVGMISVDDLLIDLAADLSDLVRPVTAEVLFGHHDPPVPATR